MNEPDTVAGPRPDDVERAHLVDPADRSYRIGRWGPADDLRDLVRRYWVPTWSVPVGQEATRNPCSRGREAGKAARRTAQKRPGDGTRHPSRTAGQASQPDGTRDVPANSTGWALESCADTRTP